MTPDTPGSEGSAGIDPRIVTLGPPLAAAKSKSLLLIFYVSTMLCVIAAWGYVQMVTQWWWFIFLLPIEVLAFAYIFVLSSLAMVKVVVHRIDARHPPAEGRFRRDGPEARAMLARDGLKHYAIWLARNSTFPWIDKIAFTMFGVKVGKTVVLHEAWVDPELVQVGDYCMIGMNSVVMSRFILGDEIIVKKVVIGDHSIIGAYTVVAPGTVVGDSTVLGANSGTAIDQAVDGHHLYAGNPARKLKAF